MPIRANNSVSGAVVDRRPTTYKLNCCQKFRLFCHNKEDKTYCTKTCPEWGKLFLFYLIFLGIVALIFASSLMIYLAIIGKDEVWKSKTDLMEVLQPGISFFPDASGRKSPMILYGWNKDLMSYHRYVNQIEKKFKAYRKLANSGKHYDCSKTVKHPCRFNISELGPCGEKGKDNYGYLSNKPCIYIELNRVHGWTPSYIYSYNIPKKFPPRLKKIITEEKITQVVWLDCNGKHSYDQEYIGKITYYPLSGFKGYYYPFTTQAKDRFVSPIVAIKLNNLKRGYLVNLRCTIYAKNIENQDASNLDVQIYIPLSPSQQMWPPP